jgi:putative two-component system response regulator
VIVIGPHAPEGAAILVADDNEAIRALLRTLLHRSGHRAIEAADGRAALAIAAANDLDLALLDVQMPGFDGIEVTRRLRTSFRTVNLPIILVTGLGDVESKVRGLDAGATDFIAKPFDHAEFLARVRAGLKMKAAFDRLEDAQSVLVALANAVEAKDPATERHCARLAELAIGLARAAGLGDDTVEAVGYGAALHDVGKIGVPEAILHKDSSLTHSERSTIQEHSATGASIVAPLRLGLHVAPIVRGHHERWDGSGYPDGLRREEIPIGARIVAIVDTFDAITNDRPYRDARSVVEAHEELTSGAGSQFDPELVAIFRTAQAEDPDLHADVLVRTRGLRTVRGAA